MQLRNFIYQNKLILFLVLALMILFPLGIYGMKLETRPQPSPAIKQLSPTIDTTQLNEVDPQKRLLDYIKNRRPLSDSDAKAKAVILDSLATGQSGSIFQTEMISVEYVKSADLFQVEIRTPDIDAAKGEAIMWFQNNGISSKGACNLPVSFYLNYGIANDLKNENKEVPFNPLPPGC